MPSGVFQKFHHGGTTLNKYVAAAIVLASLTAGAQTTKPTTPAPAKPATPAKTTTPAPAKTTTPAKPAAAPKPAAPATTAAAPTRHYKVADDAFISSCTGWAASYAKAPKHAGKLTITGTCTAPSNVRLYLSSRKSSAKGTRNYALVQSWPLKSKQSTKTGSASVKRVVYTNTAPTSVMVGKSSVTVSNSSPAPAAPAPKPAPAKPAPAKPATTPAKPAPAPVKK
jgi:hypothetical protein